MGNLSGCIPEVFDQKVMDCCYAATISAAIYAEHYLSHYKGTPKHGCSHGVEGSIHELIDCLHWIFRPRSSSTGPLWIPRKGLPNLITNGFQYVKWMGIFPAHVYEFENNVGHCREPSVEESENARFEVKPPESSKLEFKAKIFIEDFDRVRMPREAHFVTAMALYRKMIEDRVQIQPVICDVVMTQSMALYTWNPEEDQIYLGKTEEEDKQYKVFLDEKERCKKEGLPSPSPPKGFGKHAMLLVGYGVKDGISYYILKNSHGRGFGYRGYIKVKTDLVGGFHYPKKAYVATEKKP